MQKNVRPVSKTVHFYTLPLVPGIMVDECEHILVLALITAIMVEYYDNFHGLPHSAEPKIRITHTNRTGIDLDPQQGLHATVFSVLSVDFVAGP